MTASKRIWCAIALLLPASACTEHSILGTDNVGWVTTLVDTTTTAIESARTFALPDTIVELRGQAGLSHAADHEIAASVRAHFVGLGWREVPLGSSEVPDVVIVLGALSQTEVGVIYPDWFGAWGWLPYWGPAADPTWIWGVPAGVPYVFEVGTLVITMVDLRTPREVTKEVPLLWVASINAVLNGTANLPRALNGIDQAFKQSPYLEVE